MSLGSLHDKPAYKGGYPKVVIQGGFPTMDYDYGRTQKVRDSGRDNERDNEEDNEVTMLVTM